MQAPCSNCGTKHVLKDADVAVHARVQFQCSKCGHTTIVEIERRPDRTVVMTPLPSFARSGASATNVSLLLDDDGLQLPANKAVSLTVVAGPDKGAVHKLKKARVILGREDADISLNDQEISRHHCLIEAREGHANLKDLDSTNGTFFDEERVRAAMLRDGSEFRIGTTLLRINFKPK
jgi:Inner membrane component of T3SS, cytoplasmic domain